MTESTRFLTAQQAAAKLGVKPATLYAYVSRGLLLRYPGPDGRTSRFDPADVARLSKRSSARRRPSDVDLTSDLVLVDGSAGRIWYRGVDALRACRELPFEEIATFLWTGRTERGDPWRADLRSSETGTAANASLPEEATPSDRLAVIATAVARSQAARPQLSGANAGRDVMASLLECLPGATAHGGYASTAATKLLGRAPSTELVACFDAALSLVCGHSLSNAVLIARLVASSGGSVGDAVAAAIPAAAREASPIANIEHVLAIAARTSATEAVQQLERASIDFAWSKDPYRTGDPRAIVLMQMLREASPTQTAIADDVLDAMARRGSPPPTAAFAVGALAFATDLPVGSGPAIWLIAKAAGFVAHAIEETLRPTIYRPRLAYTGPLPREGTPRRAIDAVQRYLER